MWSHSWHWCHNCGILPGYCCYAPPILCVCVCVCVCVHTSHASPCRCSNKKQHGGDDNKHTRTHTHTSLLIRVCQGYHGDEISVCVCLFLTLSSFQCVILPRILSSCPIRTARKTPKQKQEVSEHQKCVCVCDVMSSSHHMKQLFTESKMADLP